MHKDQWTTNQMSKNQVALVAYNKMKRNIYKLLLMFYKLFIKFYKVFIKVFINFKIIKGRKRQIT